MGFAQQTLVVAVLLFVGMVILLEAGRRAQVRRRVSDPTDPSPGVGALEAAVYGLLALLVAFTFSGAASRFDARRQLVVQEANAIGTAYLRLDLLPPAARPALRDSFRRYLDSRLEAYRQLPDVEAFLAAFARSVALQGEIWTRAVAACPKAEAGTPACMLLVPALNEMFDITTTRRAALDMHPPAIIFVMLCALALVTALVAGYNLTGDPRHNWLPMIGFAITVAITVYVILDIEYPRLGLIRVNAIDRMLVELRASMK